MDKFKDPKTGKELFKVTDNKEILTKEGKDHFIKKLKSNPALSHLTDEELIEEFEKRFKDGTSNNN